jgi:hypothetical protein
MAEQKIVSVELEQPFTRGEQTIDTIQLRKPAAGELRGLSLQALHTCDYSALETLLTRISIPTLSKPEIAALDSADFSQLGSEILDFLLPKSVKAVLPNA